MSGIKNPIQNMGFTPEQSFKDEFGGFTGFASEYILQSETAPVYCRYCGKLIDEGQDQYQKETDWDRYYQERKAKLHTVCAQRLYQRMMSH